jgi:hypothetical protein
MIANIDRLLAESATKLRYVRDRHVIKRPEGVFVERGVALRQSNFDAVRQQIVLSEKVSFLDKIKECGVVTFRNNHSRKEPR